MAIHQHLSQYVQASTINTSNLSDIMDLIRLMTEVLNTSSFDRDTIEQTSIKLLNTISIVEVQRESNNIKAMTQDSGPIVDFFRHLRGQPQCQEVVVLIINRAFQLIIRDEEVSALTCLALAVIPDEFIILALKYLFNQICYNDQKAIVKAVGRLIEWHRLTMFNVPLHLWIVKGLTVLHDQKQFQLLNEIISNNIIRCCISLIIPVFQLRIFPVVKAMLELQQSEEIFSKVSPRFERVLTQLSKQNQSEIFEPLMAVMSDYLGNFPQSRNVCKEAVEFLEEHGHATNHNNSKYRRLTSSNFLANNVRIGLENLGNTCYMNSVLQSLFMTKSFCRELLSKDHPDRSVLTVQKIFGLLLFSDRSELNIKFALPHIRPNEFVLNLQQDSSEFMGSLLDKLHEADKKNNQPTSSDDDWDETTVKAESIIKPSTDVEMEAANDDEEGETMPVDRITDNTNELNQSTLVQRVFGGKISTTCICSSCRSKSITIDSFRDLALSFPEGDKNEDIEFSVQNLLDFYFTTEKLTLDSDNQYHCEKCKILCDGFRCTEIIESPKNLILTLKHFSYDSRDHTRSKLLINKMFHDEEISVKVRVSQNGTRTVNYRLYAAVVHSGISLDSGHYYTFAREKEDIWYKFNDSFVSSSTLQDLHRYGEVDCTISFYYNFYFFNSLTTPNTPYILFYRRISTASATASSAQACSIDQLVPDDDKLPMMNDLPPIVRSFIQEDNATYKRESKKFNFQFNKPLSTVNDGWNDDDQPPPSSCGGGLDVQPNYIC